MVYDFLSPTWTRKTWYKMLYVYKNVKKMISYFLPYISNACLGKEIINHKSKGYLLKKTRKFRCTLNMVCRLPCKVWESKTYHYCLKNFTFMEVVKIGIAQTTSDFEQRTHNILYHFWTYFLTFSILNNFMAS